MEENSSEYSLFKILPCYKYQNELDKFIKFSDDIYIASALENINKDAYLSLATTIVGNNDGKSGSPAKSQVLDCESDDDTAAEDMNNFHDDFIIAFEKTSKFRFIFFFLNLKVLFFSFLFRFKLFCQCPNDENNSLYFGDIVWISHFEKEMCLEYKPYKTTKKFQQIDCKIGIFKKH